MKKRQRRENKRGRGREEEERQKERRGWERKENRLSHQTLPNQSHSVYNWIGYLFIGLNEHKILANFLTDIF